MLVSWICEPHFTFASMRTSRGRLTYRCRAPFFVAIAATREGQRALMVNAARFMLHRPELIGSLVRGDEKLSELMKGSVQSLPAGRVLVQADSNHEYVYRLRSGWAFRN